MPADMQFMPKPEPLPSRTIIDIHSPQGERCVELIIETWLSYYYITTIKADDFLVADIILMLETYGTSLGLKQQKNKASLVDTEFLANLVGNIVLARGVAENDGQAIEQVRTLCLEVISSVMQSKLDDNSIEQILDETVHRVVESLTGTISEFSEFPVSMKSLIDLCTYEAMAKFMESHGISVPQNVRMQVEEKAEELAELLSALRHEGVKEDRIWHLLHAPMYCDCIKRAFITLKPKQQLLLALCYFENERIPDYDVLEALADVGMQHTQRNSPINEDNVDRNLHDVLRRVLPNRLAKEFALSIDDRMCGDSSKISGYGINSAIKPYLDQTNNPPRANLNKLLELCHKGLGTKKGPLMGKEILTLCRLLSQNQSEEV